MAATPYLVTRGIVLRETVTKEADKILTLLTEDRGKISVIARGVRRKGCKYAACAQPLVYAEWTLYQKGDWYYANEGATLELFGGLQTDLENFSLGCYFAELTEAVTTEEQPAHELLRHLLNGLYALAVLGVTGAAGIFYAPSRIARKARLWLLLALIAQFVTLSTIRQLLGLAPLNFDYTVQLPDPGKMPLAGKDVVNLLVPDDAENIHIYGTRGVETRVQCKVDGEGLKKFAQKHKFELPENTGKEFVFGNNEFVIFIYNPNTQILTGYFKRDGLPEKLRRPEKAVSDSK